MITRVLLRNWRGYEKLGLDLGPGLTFVIADNGVGKTSLVNGVAWALFGDASGVDGDAAIRAGTAETTVEVDLTIGPTRFSVSRSLRRTGRSRETLTVQVDGSDAAGSPKLRRSLSDAAAVPYEILPQLMLVPEMRLTHEGELFADVQDHLAGLLGIDDLRNAAKTAREVHAGAAKEIRATRELVRMDEAVVEATGARISEIDAEIEQIDAALAEDAAQRDELDAALRRLEEWASYDEEAASYRHRLDELADAARGVGIAVGGDGDPEPIAEAGRQVTQQSAALNTDLAEARAEEALVLGLIDQLDSAEAVCPVCLRPVDGDVARHASDAHRARLAEIEQRQTETESRRQEVDAAVRQIGALATTLARLRPPDPPDGPRPSLVAADVEAQRFGLEAATTDKISRKGALGEQLRQAEHTLSEADRSQAATAELAQLHAVAAAASSLATLATAEADGRTERCLDPLSRTLASRWAEFFVGSSSRPRLAGGGSIELGAGEATIPYSSFSGGEKTLASLLTRLLFVTSATGLDSMWLDEPLEHLDPANRIKVARLLAQVTQSGSHMRQVLVTTYEEGLARSMIERHDATSIVYVSTDELL
jgi:DNA repair exonuclease SbcCD ATPase subunit